MNEMATYKNMKITLEFMDSNPDAYFIFGDNLMRKSNSEQTKAIRVHPHSLGFITKKFPSDDDGSFYKPEEYEMIFFEELIKISKIIDRYPTKTFYISKIGSGSANRFRIWEKLISVYLVRALEKYNNVVFCWKNEVDIVFPQEIRNI